METWAYPQCKNVIGQLGSLNQEKTFAQSAKKNEAGTRLFLWPKLILTQKDSQDNTDTQNYSVLYDFGILSACSTNANLNSTLEVLDNFLNRLLATSTSFF